MEWKKSVGVGAEKMQRRNGKRTTMTPRLHSEKDEARECRGKRIKLPTADSQICCDAIHLEKKKKKKKFPHRTLLPLLY